MTRTLLTVVAIVAISAAVPAQAPEPPMTGARLTVHTLLREDIFAGFMQGDVGRMARAEKNADQLLASRPADRASILAWPGSLALTRAVMASETNQPDQFLQHYRRAQDLFAEAIKLGPDVVGVFAVTGGARVALADRLPAAERKAAAQVERILTLLPGTAYASRALQWKDDPTQRATSKLACQTCHGHGTLVARLVDVSKQ